jgi:hypothetical protein
VLAHIARLRKPVAEISSAEHAHAQLHFRNAMNTAALMPEVPRAGEDERHAVLVAARDGFLLPLASPRLRDDPDAAVARLLNGVLPSCACSFRKKKQDGDVTSPNNLEQDITFIGEEIDSGASHRRGRRRRLPVQLPWPLFSRLPRGDPEALSPAWLAAAHPQRAVVLQRQHQIKQSDS